MRYLMAKRLLSDLSVFVCQLQPYCASAVAGAGRHSNKIRASSPSSPSSFTPTSSSSPPARSGGSAATSVKRSSRSRSPSPRLLIVRRSADTSLPQRLPLPLPHLVGCIAALVEAVASYPLRCRPRPVTTATLEPPPAPVSARVGVSSPKRDSPAGDETEQSRRLLKSAQQECGGHVDGGDGSGGEGVVGRGGAVRACDQVEGLRDGSLASCSVGVDVVAGASGTARVVGTLFSLVAAMVGAEGRGR